MRDDIQRVIQNVLVEGNLVKNSVERSGLIIAMDDCSDYYGGTCYGNIIQNVVIRNNIFTANNFVGVQIIGKASGLQIYNNTFYQNGRQGIDVDPTRGVDQVDIRGNLIFQSANPNCASNCSWFDVAPIQASTAVTHLTIDTNYYYPGTVQVLDEHDNPWTGKDPHPVTGAVKFVHPITFDFHVLAGSVVIDKNSFATTDRDFDGVQRPKNSSFDLGAFEYYDGFVPQTWYDLFMPTITIGQ